MAAKTVEPTRAALVSELAALIAALEVVLNQLGMGQVPQPASRRFETVKGQGRGSKKPPAKLKSA
jgi:hypothetical protein